MEPTSRCVLLLAAGMPLALAPAVIDARLWPAWLALLVLSLALVALDALLLLPPSKLAVESALPERIYVGTEEPWRLRIRALGARRGTELEVLGDLDRELEAQPARRVELPPDGEIELAIPLRARRRGTVRVDALWLRWLGPLGLLRRVRRREVGARIAVVPDVGAVRAAALRAFRSPRAFAGWKSERYVGDGSEFESLRQHVPGLDVRHIDWKSSARHKRLLARRFRSERNHQVVLAIDSGHLMSEPLGGLARLDHAIHAALMLAYFCLRTGDRVGMASFDARFRHFLEPQGGMRAFHRLQVQSAAIEYSSVETNFTLGALELSARLRRRSLVVVFTEFVDTVTAELLFDNLSRLAKRHVIVFVSLRDPELERLELAEPRAPIDVGRAVVAADLRRERELVFRRLRQIGVHHVDARPGDLALDLLNRYFDIQRRELV